MSDVAFNIWMSGAAISLSLWWVAAAISDVAAAIREKK